MITRSETKVETRRAKTPTCWSKSDDAEFLKVELRDGSIFLFPYRHLEYARLRNEAGTLCLKISFASHLVGITGRNLVDLVSEFQNCSVGTIRAIAERYSNLLPPDSVLIDAIEVQETSEGES